MKHSKERRPDLIDQSKKVFEFLKVITFEAGEEIYRGLKCQTIPLRKCTLIGLLLSTLYHFQLDARLLLPFRLNHLVLGGFARFFVGTYLILLPIHFWGLSKTAEKLRMKRRMKKMFQATGIETRLKETPTLIGDYPIDEWTRKLKLFSEGIPAKRYLEKKVEIESILNASIIKASNPPARKDLVEIVYSRIDMPTLFKLDSIQAYKDFSFPIGMTWGREVTTSLKDVPHFLIAGESGGGKSTFISMMTSVLLATNDLLNVVFVDMKGGMQARIFEGLDRVEVASKPRKVRDRVFEALSALDTRMALFRQFHAKDIDQYNAKYKGQRPSVERIVFIVDEFSELIPKFNSADRKILTEINDGLLRIARMGRACGIHLVIGIQKPDNNNIDPGIKANLPGIVCFPVTHFSQSMLILGDGRAADLPADVKGRAIWKYGIDQIEVQTPYVSESEIEELRKTLVRKEVSENENQKDATNSDPTRATSSKASLEVESRKSHDDQDNPSFR